MKVKGVIFDMDGTLVDSLMYWGDFWKRVGAAYLGDPEFSPDEAIDQKVRTMIYTDAMEYVWKTCGIGGELSDFLAFSEDGVADFYRNTATVKPGAVALLTDLKARGFRLCLASATDMPMVRLALDCYGLTEYFDAVLSCADLGVGKDQPDIYYAAARALSRKPEELAVVEDSFTALETAKKAGFRTVGVFDRCNTDQDRLKASSEFYLGDGGTLDELIPVFEASEA